MGNSAKEGPLVQCWRMIGSVEAEDRGRGVGRLVKDWDSCLSRLENGRY